MALPSKAVIEAYAEEYTVEQIKGFRSAALEAHAKNLPRVELTGVNMEGGGGQGVFVDKDPAELIELFSAVLKVKEAGDGKRVNRSIVNADFSMRQVGW